MIRFVSCWNCYKTVLASVRNDGGKESKTYLFHRVGRDCELPHQQGTNLYINIVESPDFKLGYALGKSNVELEELHDTLVKVCVDMKEHEHHTRMKGENRKHH